MYSKIHRCGWCGNPTTKDGIPLEDENRERVISILEKYGDYRTHKEYGECCAYDKMMRQEQSRMSEMAHDTEMP